MSSTKEKELPSCVSEVRTGSVQELAEESPHPTDDELDPLNWSRAQKRTSLGIVMWMYFLFTYITTTTVPSLPLLQEQYLISYALATWTVAIPALGLSLGPLFWSPLSCIYGRRTVIVLGTAIAFAATVWSAVAKTYVSYMAARLVQGVGVSPAATVGMAVVGELFCEAERGEKMGMWVLALDLGLLVGPLVGGFVALVDQYMVAWVTAILFGLLLVAELLFFPETLYPRTLILSRLPTGEKVCGDDIRRTKQLPFLNLSPVPGVERAGMADAVVGFVKVWALPNVAVAVGFYCFAWYWWVLSVITYLPVAYAQYTPDIQGLLFIGLILGTLVSEVCCSGAMGDNIMAVCARRNRGVRVPEMRLWMVYPAIAITAVGLVLWGVSVEKGWHWAVGQVALFLFAAGIQMGNTAVSVYIVDCHSTQTMSVMVFYSVLLNFSAFVNPFFIAPWVDSVGFAWTFGVQGGIVIGVMVPVTVGLQWWGRGWRKGEGVEVVH